MDYFLVCVIVILLILMVHRIRSRTRLNHLKKLPGEPPQFLIGNIGWILNLYWRSRKYHPGVYILQKVIGTCQLYRKNGFHLFWIGSEPIVSVYSPELVELVLSSSVSLEKSFEYSLLHRWLGTGLLTSKGMKWKSRRKLLTPCFHFRILDDFLPTFNEQSRVLVKKLMSLTHEESVDIGPLVVLCTLDIVCETVMGAQIGAQQGANSDYVTAVHNLADFFNQRNIQPWLYSDFLFGLTKIGRKFDTDLEILHGFTKKVIKEKKESRKKTPVREKKKEEDENLIGKKRQALMDLLLDLHLDGGKLSEKDIQEEVDTFMFEGHDTTAMGIIFALYCIGLYPEIQKKIHEELDSIFCGDNDRPVTMDDVRDMKYFDCTLKESQRLFPSVPLIGRKLNEDIQYNGFTIPKDTTIHCNIISLHKDPHIFPESELFDPERFSQENALNRHPYAYVPFSAGPRNCIGQKFALLEEKVVLSNILRKFRIESLDPRDRVHQKVEFTLRPEDKMRMKFSPRI